MKFEATCPMCKRKFTNYTGGHPFCSVGCHADAAGPEPKRPTVLICGGRDFDNRGLVYRTLDEISPTCVIHGACGVDADDPYWINMKGADDLADDWAIKRGVTKHRRPAAWKRLGKKAGPIRNQAMLDEFAQVIGLVVAFEGGNGTANMVALAKKAGIPVLEVKP